MEGCEKLFQHTRELTFLIRSHTLPVQIMELGLTLISLGGQARQHPRYRMSLARILSKHGWRPIFNGVRGALCTTEPGS